MAVLAYWLCWIQSLPAFQTKPKPRKTDGGPWENITWSTNKKNDKYNEKDNDKYIKRTLWKSNLWDPWPLRHLIRMMRKYDLTKKRQWRRQIQRQWQRQWQIHLENSFKEWSLILLTFKTIAQLSVHQQLENATTVSQTHNMTIYRVFFFTGPPLKC